MRQPISTYVAVEREIAAEVLRKLEGAKVKGRSVKVRMLDVDGEGASPPGEAGYAGTMPFTAQARAAKERGPSGSPSR